MRLLDSVVTIQASVHDLGKSAGRACLTGKPEGFGNRRSKVRTHRPSIA
jgi:hypothetical protein